MSLGPESLTRALCQPRYRSDGETIMTQTRHPTASDMSTKTCHSHNGEAPLEQRTLDYGLGAGAPHDVSVIQDNQRHVPSSCGHPDCRALVYRAAHEIA